MKAATIRTDDTNRTMLKAEHAAPIGAFLSGINACFRLTAGCARRYEICPLHGL